MRTQRLTEIYDDNLMKIDAPFDYQIRLLGEEEDDILEARANAVRDSNDAYDDLEWRLDSLSSDIIEDQQIEQERILQAIQRSLVDKKNPAKVFLALKIDWMDTVVVDPTTLTTLPVTGTGLTQDFSDYDGMFNDFHYDIGHGKGTGETRPLPDANVRDGYNNRRDPRQTGPVGDYETDRGAKTWAWEMNGSKYGGGY